jgi:hypothetical protein
MKSSLTKRSSKKNSKRSPKKNSKRSPKKNSKRSPKKNSKRSPKKFSKRSQNNFSFYAYYDAKPRVNKKLQTSKIEFENRGKSVIFSGNVKADSKQTVKKWLKSLGHVTKWIDSNRDAMEVHHYK